jgi:hypothetical protein
MIIKHDYSYLGSNEKLIEKGYADLDIHSINFDRYFSEEEKENNRLTTASMTNEQWSKHCDEASKKIYNQMLPIVELLNNKYDIHQISKEKSTMVHYKSDWDLFFYSNEGWNNKNYFDYIQISFNEKKAVIQNMELLNEVLKTLEQLDVKNVYCRVQYTAREHKEKIKNKVTEICESLVDKLINYNGMEGKIKVIDEFEGEKMYGFFKKRVRKSYYNISYSYLILNYT